MYVMTNPRHHYWNSYRMTKNVGISNPFEVTERTTLAVQSTVEVFHDFIFQSALHPFGHLS